MSFLLLLECYCSLVKLVLLINLRDLLIVIVTSTRSLLSPLRVRLQNALNLWTWILIWYPRLFIWILCHLLLTILVSSVVAIVYLFFLSNVLIGGCKDLLLQVLQVSLLIQIRLSLLERHLPSLGKVMAAIFNPLLVSGRDRIHRVVNAQTVVHRTRLILNRCKLWMLRLHLKMLIIVAIHRFLRLTHVV
jgi:hypothetical protein